MGSNNKDDVKPINLKSEKEIVAEFTKVSSVLENYSNIPINFQRTGIIFY